MAIIDIVILAIIGVSALIGVFRGLVKEALSLASWVAAIFVAGIFSPQLADLMSGMISSSSVRFFAAFALLFIATIFIGALIANLVSKLTSAVGLGGVDRLLGGLFGIIRGTLVVLLLVLIAQPFDFTVVWFENSVLVPYAVVLIEYLQNILELDNVAIDSIA